MFDDIAIFVPRVKEILIIYEGTGDNLLDEDIEEGYVDYINYDVYGFIGGSIDEIDGGMILTREPVRERYGTLDDAIPDVLEMAYGFRDENTIRM